MGFLGKHLTSETANPLTTKGDLAGYSTATTRIPIGANGQSLYVDSTQANGLKWAYLNVVTNSSTTYAVTTANDIILNNATSAAITNTLPTAVGISGKVFYIKKIDSSGNTVTINTTSSQTIDGVTSKIMSTQYNSLTVVSDGSNWYLI